MFIFVAISFLLVTVTIIFVLGKCPIKELMHPPPQRLLHYVIIATAIAQGHS